MRRREFLGALPVALWPGRWGTWREEGIEERELPDGQVEFRLRARHSLTGAPLENAVRILPVEGGALRPEERARARGLAVGMLRDWLRRREP